MSVWVHTHTMDSSDTRQPSDRPHTGQGATASQSSQGDGVFAVWPGLVLISEVASIIMLVIMMPISAHSLLPGFPDRGQHAPPQITIASSCFAARSLALCRADQPDIQGNSLSEPVGRRPYSTRHQFARSGSLSSGGVGPVLDSGPTAGSSNSPGCQGVGRHRSEV